MCEPFTQWVLEDRFGQGRPPFEDAGVQMVDDVVPYELMKLRLLNASHQALCYLGFLSGYRYAHEVCQDPLFARFLLAYMEREGSPTLPEVPGVDLDAYRHQLVERFANPEVRDTLARLCAESSDRIPKWLVPVIQANLRDGGEVELSALVVASWARYAEGVDEQGDPIEVVDRLKDRVMAAAAQQQDDPLAFLRDRDLFGDLADDERFTAAYTAALDSLAHARRPGDAGGLERQGRRPEKGEAMRVAVLNQPGDVEVVERPTAHSCRRRGPGPRPRRRRVRLRHPLLRPRPDRTLRRGVARWSWGTRQPGSSSRSATPSTPARVGQRVSIEPGVPCRACEQCLAGRYNLCPDMVFHATPPVDGSLAELVTIHHAFAHPVPDSVSDEAAALLEPLVRRGLGLPQGSRSGPGSRVLVTGAGPIGLVCVQVARACGASEIVVADLNPSNGSPSPPSWARRSTITSGDTRASRDGYAGRPAPEVLLECSGHPGATGRRHPRAGPGRAGRARRAWAATSCPCRCRWSRSASSSSPAPSAMPAPGPRRSPWPRRVRSTWSDWSRAGSGWRRHADALTAARDVPGAIKSVIDPRN